MARTSAASSDRGGHDGHAHDDGLHPGHGHVRPSITDNAGGIAEFSRAEAGAREITDRLDAVGNTTKALTKGSPSLRRRWPHFLLFSAYIDKVNLIQTNRGGALLTSVNLADVNVFIAALIGAMLVYFFSSLAIRAVGTTAQAIIVEVRRQFREMPGSWITRQRPDYARVVTIHDPGRPSRDDLPGVVAVATPIVVGRLSWAPSGGRPADGRDDLGRPAGDRPQQRWRRLGQRKEVHRIREPEGRRWRGPGQEDAGPRRAVVGDTVGDPFRTPQAPPSTSWSSCWPRSPSCLRRCSSGSRRT